MKIELSARDIDLLEEYFEAAKDLVNYSAFVEVCEQVFIVKHLEKNPLNNPNNEVNYLDPRDVLNDQEEQVLEDCMKRLGFFVFTKRLHIKPFFQDKDRVNAGWVVSTRFRSILSFAGIMISEAEFDVLSKRFSHKRNEINYSEFCLVLAKYSKDDQLF